MNLEAEATDGMVEAVRRAAIRLQGIVTPTPLQEVARLSRRYGGRVLIKREDLHEVRSFKIRGAYNQISAIPEPERERGVVCASAGNHAQGVAFACSRLGIRGTVFMPSVTPMQKIDRVKQFGGEFIEVVLSGDSYDDAGEAARHFAAERNAVFVHPFDDPATIAGQGTVGKEIFDQAGGEVDIVLCAIGGGGLIAGVAAYLRAMKPEVVFIGVEPAGAPAMRDSLRAGHVVTLDRIDTFVDGAAVKTVGNLPFEICRTHVERVVTVAEGQICTTMIELYQNEGVIAEPAGALSVSGLDEVADQIRGRTAVCVLSGGNNDILRYPEIMERSLVHQGRKHYFIIEFAQKPGQLRQFVDRALGPTDDIVRFEYIKKTERERGAALVGIELKHRSDLEPLLRRMQEIELAHRLLSSEDLLYQYLI